MTDLDVDYIVQRVPSAGISILRAALRSEDPNGLALRLVGAGLPGVVSRGQSERRELQIGLLYVQQPRRAFAEMLLDAWMERLNPTQRLSFYRVKQNGSSLSFGLLATISHPFIGDIRAKYGISLYECGIGRQDGLTTAILDGGSAVIDAVLAENPPITDAAIQQLVGLSGSGKEPGVKLIKRLLDEGRVSVERFQSVELEVSPQALVKIQTILVPLLQAHRARNAILGSVGAAGVQPL